MSQLDGQRRSGRATTKTKPFEVTDTPRNKRKAKEFDTDALLESLLSSPKSMLCTTDLSDIQLLPEPAFLSFIPQLDASHPSISSSPLAEAGPSMLVERTLVNMDPSMPIFNDPHFLAAARTFQDHLYSGWLTAKQKGKVKEYQDGVCCLDPTGSIKLAAPWKDVMWERDAAEEAQRNDPFYERLTDMVKHKVLQVGDILAYKHSFPNDGTSVEKDVIIYSIQRNSGVTVLIQPSTERYLPVHLTCQSPVEPDAPTKEMTITSPSMLENGILDVDGRIERTARHGAGPNIWKRFTVWRWRQAQEVLLENERGGRENHGTLHYLRGSYLHDL